MKTILFSIVFLIHLTAQAQGFHTDSIHYFGRLVDFQVPNDTNKSLSRYTEGTFYSYTFNDSSSFVIHIGGNLNVPILDDDEYIVHETIDGQRFGIRESDSLFWSEINVNDRLNLFYDRVKEENKIKMDSILEEIQARFLNSR